MGVNAVIDNAGTQQMAVAISSNVAQQLKEMDRADTRDGGKEKVSAESEVSKLVQDGTNPSKAGMNVLLSLAAKLSTVGVNLSPERFSGKAKDEIENELNQLRGGNGSFDDLVDLNSLVGRVTEQKQQKENQQKEQNARDNSLLSDRDVQKSVKEYASLYAQYTVSHSPEIKKKLDKLENELREKGLTPKDFISIKTAASNSIRKELALQVKDAFLKKILSPEKSVEMVVNEKGLNSILDFALLQEVHDNDSLQTVANDVIQDTAEDLKDFSRAKMEEKLMRKHLTADGKEEKGLKGELKELVKLAGRVGVDLNQFVNDWQGKKFDLGLFIADIPAGQCGTNFDSSNGGRQKNNPYEFTQEDEKDLLTSRLRAIHMHRALNGDWKTVLGTQFKMSKLKNGLIKLGVTSDELAKLEKEGFAAARIRLLEMLKGGLEEKATLYELAGPAFKLIEQKIKGILSNLKRLDCELDEIEFNSLKDSANIKVFDAAREELLTLKDMLGGISNPGLEKRYKLVLKLLKRLKEESNLTVEIPEEEFKVKEAV